MLDATAAWDAAELGEVIREGRPRLVWLANPANPTGRSVSLATITTLLDHFAGILVVDEAFYSLTAKPVTSLSLTASGRVIVVRSLTKDFSLAGLRLGYLVAHPKIVATIRCARMPWSVNALAQVAGVAALDQLGWLETCRTRPIVHISLPALERQFDRG